MISSSDIERVRNIEADVSPQLDFYHQTVQETENHFIVRGFQYLKQILELKNTK